VMRPTTSPPVAVGHTSSQRSVMLPERIWLSIRRRYVPARSTTKSVRVLMDLEHEPPALRRRALGSRR
jgi:hypothetical protein